MKRSLYILAISFMFFSCIKNEYEGYEVPPHQYEGPYEQYEAVKVTGFQTVNRGVNCDLLIRYELDTAKFNIHPNNLGHIIISLSGNDLQRSGVENNTSILPDMCSKPRIFKLRLTDEDGYQVGKETTARWE